MNIVIKVNDEIKEKMIEYYKDKKRDKVIPYVVFQAEEEDTVITLYESGKCMFQGKSADVDAAMWGVAIENTKENKDKKKDEYKKYYESSSVGSDEVGTGDYFGPIVVTAAYVNKKDIKKLEELGVGDSKKIDDSKIKKIAPELTKIVKYRSLIINNKEYNEQYNIYKNLNKIKAIMHNKVLYQLIHEENLKPDYIIVDEFAREAKYYEYINEDPNMQKGITFITKAEDISLAVASASIISRYIFLKEFDKLSDELHIPLLKGASRDVDKVGKEVVEKYGIDKLKEIAKFDFHNTERIINTGLD